IHSFAKSEPDWRCGDVNEAPAFARPPSRVLLRTATARREATARQAEDRRSLSANHKRNRTPGRRPGRMVRAEIRDPAFAISFAPLRRDERLRRGRQKSEIKHSRQLLRRASMIVSGL